MSRAAGGDLSRGPRVETEHARPVFCPQGSIEVPGGFRLFPAPLPLMPVPLPPMPAPLPLMPAPLPLISAAFFDFLDGRPRFQRENAGPRLSGRVGRGGGGGRPVG